MVGSRVFCVAKSNQLLERVTGTRRLDWVGKSLDEI
jgi:hypothetical protein